MTLFLSHKIKILVSFDFFFYLFGINNYSMHAVVQEIVEIFTDTEKKSKIKDNFYTIVLIKGNFIKFHL